MRKRRIRIDVLNNAIKISRDRLLKISEMYKNEKRTLENLEKAHREYYIENPRPLSELAKYAGRRIDRITLILENSKGERHLIIRYDDEDGYCGITDEGYFYSNCATDWNSYEVIENSSSGAYLVKDVKRHYGEKIIEISDYKVVGYYEVVLRDDKD